MGAFTRSEGARHTLACM